MTCLFFINVLSLEASSPAMASPASCSLLTSFTGVASNSPSHHSHHPSSCSALPFRSLFPHSTASPTPSDFFLRNFLHCASSDVSRRFRFVPVSSLLPPGPSTVHPHKSLSNPPSAFGSKPANGRASKIALWQRNATENQGRDGTGEEKSENKGGITRTAVEEPSKESSGPESKPPEESTKSPKTIENSILSNINSVQLDSTTVRQLLGPEKVDPDDVKLFKERAFGYTTFWVTGQESFGEFGEGVLFLGNLRANRETVYGRLREILSELFGNKYDFFMLEEENATEEDARGGPRVSFVLLRKEVSLGAPTSAWQYVIAFILVVITGGACLELGLASQVSKLPPEIVSYFTSPDIDSLDPPSVETLTPYVEAALPLAYGVFGVQALHEIGHRLAAARRKVALGIPFLIPNVTIGTFGAVTQFKSPCPDRTAKFDIAVAGPLAGGLLSMAMFAIGLFLTADPNTPTSELVQVPALVFQGSLLLGLISRSVLGYGAMHAATVAIHPLLIAGWCGITTTALNLMPVGSVDGGRAMQAAFGKRVLNVSSLVSYFSLGLGLVGGALSLPWGLFVLILQRTPEKPCLNNVSEVGNGRKALMVALLSFSLFVLLPVWDNLAEELGIGLGALPL